MRQAAQPSPPAAHPPQASSDLASRRRERIRGIGPLSAERVKEVPICPTCSGRAGAVERGMAFFVRETAGQIGASYVS